MNVEGFNNLIIGKNMSKAIFENEDYKITADALNFIIQCKIMVKSPNPNRAQDRIIREPFYYPSDWGGLEAARQQAERTINKAKTNWQRINPV